MTLDDASPRSTVYAVTVEADDWWAARLAASSYFLQRAERGLPGGALLPPSSPRLLAVPEERRPR